jgi:hypothetical protein
MRIFMPADEHESMHALSDDRIQQFIQEGFVRIDRAFPREIADETRAILWRDTGCDPHDPATWTKPVIRLSGYKDAPFLKAERTPVLHAAFDQIVGKGTLAPGVAGLRGGVCSCASRIPAILATTAGISTSAFLPTVAIRTSGAISPSGART